MRTIVREEGMKGLWKGNLSAEMLYLSYGAIQFTTYHEAMDAMSALNTLGDGTIPIELQTFVAGALAGCTATIITYPFDLLRTRFAVQGNSQASKVYPSYLSACRTIFTTEGLSGFYRGVWPATLQIMPYMGIMFESHRVCIETIKRVRSRFAARKGSREMSGGWESLSAFWGGLTSTSTITRGGTKSTKGNTHEGVDEFLAGGIAGVVSKTAVMPFDTIRKRLQIQGPTRRSYLTPVPHYPHPTILGTAHQIIRQEGFLALYKGLWPGLLKAGPNAA
ncbi:mitochondrial thiamine pyrophosphate transporter, partial [Quaeritorhiza haematococci]